MSAAKAGVAISATAATKQAADAFMTAPKYDGDHNMGQPSDRCR
jgi:hypothetical protein